MTSYAGTLNPSAGYDQADTWARSANLSAFDPLLDFAAAYLETYDSAPISGPLASQLPIGALPAGLDGSAARLFGADWYHRVHVLPPRLDLGNLLSAQSRDVEVWNAHLLPKTLSAIVESGTEGLEESGLVAPYAFGALKSKLFTLNITLDGSPTIDAHYTFVFPDESPVLAVTGNRILVFGYAPDWSEAPRETYAWLTDVLTAQDGSEQRVALRGAPRRGLAFRIVALDQHQCNVLETLLLGWQARLYALPVWTDPQWLAAPLAAGSLSIPCATSGYEFAPDGLALLWRDYLTFESVEVASVGGASLALKRPTVAAWPAGTRLLPVRFGRLPARQKLTRLSDTAMEASLDFAIADHPGWTPAEAGASYLGYAVYPGTPNWTGDIEVEHLRKLASLDYATGRAWVADESGRSSLLKSWHWQLATRAEIVAFRAWLAARKGRAVPFWSPTQGADLSLAASAGPADTNLTVRNIAYAKFIAGRADRRHLMIETLAGQTYYRQITGASEINAATESIGIDSALGVTLAPADIRRIRFLHLNRLEADDIEITWHTDRVAEAEAVLRSLPQ